MLDMGFSIFLFLNNTKKSLEAQFLEEPLVFSSLVSVKVNKKLISAF